MRRPGFPQRERSRRLRVSCHRPFPGAHASHDSLRSMGNDGIPPSNRIDRSSLLTRRLRAPNPGPMTLDGTNSYLIGAPGSASIVVVDPGPLDDRHLAALAAEGPVALLSLIHISEPTRQA